MVIKQDDQKEHGQHVHECHDSTATAVALTSTTPCSIKDNSNGKNTDNDDNNAEEGKAFG